MVRARPFWPTGPAAHFQPVPGYRERRLFARRIRRQAAADRVDAGASRLPALRARSELFDAGRRRCSMPSAPTQQASLSLIQAQAERMPFVAQNERDIGYPM